jgi:hypothetical protein
MNKIFIVKLDAEELDKTPMANHIDSPQTLLQRLIDFFLVTLLIANFSDKPSEQIVIIENIFL